MTVPDAPPPGHDDFTPTLHGAPARPRQPNPLLDATHDPRLRSWVESANDGATDFPLQNLPYGRFRRRKSEQPWRIGVAIGDQILDLHLATTQCPWPEEIEELLAPLAAGHLEPFMALGADAWRVLRHALSIALTEGSELGPFLELCLVPQAHAEMAMPCRVGEFTDFYTGIHHAVAVGKLFRPDNPLLPNYKWVPIAYQGRASSIGVSGQRFRRPYGQLKGPGEQPVYGPTERLEFELELGALVGPPTTPGSPVAMDGAESLLFGLVLLNDWSARDIQAWEYQPLGPFLAKSFATTLSPWVVTMEALAPFRRPFVRAAGDPQPLPYLDSSFNREFGAIDIGASAWLQTKRMREAGLPPARLSAPNFADSAYWTLAQLVTHHTANGCNLRTGDLLGTGTLSGPDPATQAGSLIELTAGGRQALVLPGGEKRVFLQDGDTVILRAGCERQGWVRIGFGEAIGTVSG